MQVLSFGAELAFKIAKQLAAMHINVVGVILVDSPSPKYPVPSSAARVDAIVWPNAVERVSEAVKLTKQQFLLNSLILIDYDPEAITASGSYPRLVVLRCVKGYKAAAKELSDTPTFFT